MKRWETMAIVAGAAVGMLAPLSVQAAVPGYTFTTPVKATGDYEGTTLMQVGDLNNKGQFTVNFILDGEKMYAWDGTALRKLSDVGVALPDGSSFVTGNVWSPHALNDNGVVAWIGDVENGSGAHYVVTYDIASGKYNIVAKPGDPADGGGEYGDGGGGPGGRMVTDINNLGQVVFNIAVPDADGEPHGGTFMYDPATQKTIAIARPGTIVDGKAITDTYYPNIADNGQVSFSANVDGADEFGIYVWDKGTITAVAAPGTQVGDVTISAARWARMAGNGDIVFVGDTGDPQAGNAEVAEGTGVFLYTAADKKLTTVLKPGDALPGGGTFLGVESNRRPVGVNSKGQVLIVGIRDDELGGAYLWQAGKLDSLVLTGDNVPGVGTVTALGNDVNGWDGYHSAINDNGDVLVPAQIDGVGAYLLATAPKPEPEPTAGN